MQIYFDFEPVKLKFLLFFAALYHQVLIVLSTLLGFIARFFFRRVEDAGTENYLSLEDASGPTGPVTGDPGTSNDSETTVGGKRCRKTGLGGQWTATKTI